MPTLSSVLQTLLFCLVSLCPLIHYHGNSAHPTNLLTTQSTPLSHLLSSEPTTQSHLPTHLQTLPPSHRLASPPTPLTCQSPPPPLYPGWGGGGHSGTEKIHTAKQALGGTLLIYHSISSRDSNHCTIEADLLVKTSRFANPCIYPG